MVQSIKFEALALHRRASELIFGQEFTLSDGSKKVWNMIPFDVQLVGALTLNGGNIPEMRTGEGKTLVATLAAYINALSGNPVHVVTVNEYLSRRDAGEMNIIYGALGLTTGVVLNNQSRDEKRKNYNCDIVYVTNTELGFDYLRDNMAPSVADQVMSRRAFAIVDEVDSILVDEARTPLIISSPDDEPTAKYLKFAQMANKLSHPEHYTVDEKTKTVALTEDGIERIEKNSRHRKYICLRPLQRPPSHRKRSPCKGMLHTGYWLPRARSGYHDYRRAHWSCHGVKEI
jgi:preprotein translocase subunit SecA